MTRDLVTPPRFRPLDARDPDTLVSLSLRLQSGATHARFSYRRFASGMNASTVGGAKPHSSRKAIRGSIRDARRAGK